MPCNLAFNLDWNDIRVIRMTIFLITGMCAGFPALLSALSVLYRHHKSRGQVSVIAVFLLLSDLLEMILIPFLVTNIFKADYEPCGFTTNLFFQTSLSGLLLHQAVALESISERYPSLINVCSCPCSSTFCIIVFLVAHKGDFLFTFKMISIIVCVSSVIVCVFTCLLTWKAPHEINEATNRKPGVLVLSVSMFTLIILHTPFYLITFIGLPYMLESLSTLRLISDPLLCVLVCREFGSNQGHRISMDGSDLSPRISISF